MNVFEDSGTAMQLAFEGGQRIAHAMMNPPMRLAARLRAWLGKQSA